MRTLQFQCPGLALLQLPDDLWRDACQSIAFHRNHPYIGRFSFFGIVSADLTCSEIFCIVDSISSAVRSGLDVEVDSIHLVKYLDRRCRGPWVWSVDRLAEESERRDVSYLAFHEDTARNTRYAPDRENDGRVLDALEGLFVARDAEHPSFQARW